MCAMMIWRHFATDNRYTDDVHFKGGCLANIQALSWAHFMFGFNARPPHPEMYAGGVEKWKEEWIKRLEKAGAPWTPQWFTNQVLRTYMKLLSILETYSFHKDLQSLLETRFNLRGL